MARFVGVPKQTGTGGGVVSGARIIGVPQAINKLVGVERAARVQLGALASNAAKNIEIQAQNYCPVITGNLKSSIESHQVAPYTWEVTASSLNGDVPEKNGKEYAGFVENGTSQMSPRYFMRRAYNDVQPLVNAEIKAMAARISVL